MDLIETFNHSGVFAKLSLLVGFVPLGVAILYMVRPLKRTLAFMRPVPLAAIFAGVVASSLASSPLSRGSQCPPTLSGGTCTGARPKRSSPPSSISGSSRRPGCSSRWECGDARPSRPFTS